MSSENEYSISNDLNESITDDNDKGSNLDEKSLITKYDKIFSDESSYFKDFEDMIDFEFSTEFSKINDNEENNKKIKEKPKFNFTRKKRCYNEVIKSEKEKKNYYPDKLRKKM